MKKSLLQSLVLALLSIVGISLAQDDSPDCGLTCIANVSDTGCAQSQWSCLCLNTPYLENLSSCARQACNQTDYDSTISIIAQICLIFSASPTVSPFATATTGTANPILSTLALTTSLPPVITNSSSSSGSNPSSTSSIDDIAGTSVSTITTTGATSSSGGAATASATTTNIAQRVDLKKSAIQGIAIALLGLAFYL